MGQSLADLVLRHVITAEVANSRSSRPDQLRGLLERAGMAPAAPAASNGFTKPPTDSGLRLASEA
jgi:hypothetical protein